MRLRIVWPFLAALSLAPTMADAETLRTADVAYCQALGDIYLRYIGRDESSTRKIVRRSGDLGAQVALTKCNARDAAAAIPVLERELIANGLALPSRT